MAKKSGLGKGLGAIFEEVEVAYEKEIKKQNSTFIEVKLDEIELNPFQPRKIFDKEALNELSHSIKKHGIIQPILVVETKHGYMLIAGERRLRASKLAGLKKIKAVVAELPESSFREIALIENIQRENLNPLELAESYKELISDYSITHEDLAEIVHKSRTHITNTLRLLNLGKYAQVKLNQGEISHGHGKIIVGLEEKEQKKIVNSIINQNLNVRQAEKLVKEMKKDEESETKKSKKTSDFDLASLTKKLSKDGLKVTSSGNKIVINFNSQKDIDNLLSLIK